MKKLGVLWLKEKEGKKYFTGNLEVSYKEVIPLIVFKNEKKTADNQPDYIIYLSEPKKQEETSPFEE